MNNETKKEIERIIDEYINELRGKSEIQNAIIYGINGFKILTLMEIKERIIQGCAKAGKIDADKIVADGIKMKYLVKYCLSCGYRENYDCGCPAGTSYRWNPNLIISEKIQDEK